MKNDSLTLKIIDNLIGNQILSIFFMVLLFLVLERVFHKKIKNRISNEQIVNFSSAFLSSSILLFLYFVIKAIEYYITQARYPIPGYQLNLPTSVFNFFGPPPLFGINLLCLLLS